MKFEILKEKDVIYNILKDDIENQIFCIGDLDDFYWNHTSWYILKLNKKVKALALLYKGSDIPTLLLFESENLNQGKGLLDKLKDQLPDKFYAHLSPNLLENFKPENIIENYGHSLKMTSRIKFDNPFDDNIRILQTEDIIEIKNLLHIAYPKNWFDERMILTGKYIGYFNDKNLIGIAGIHVYSPKYKVAALGNIATHPNFRGQNIASKLIRTLCYDLQQTVDIIGLNVRLENKAAIECYKKLGFEITGEYIECLLKN